MLCLKELAYGPRGVGPISLSLWPGEVVLLCGPSGSGKSTLCSLVTGELEPSSGSLELAPGLIGTVAADVESQLLGSTVEQELEFGRGLSLASNVALESARTELLSYWHGRGGEDPQRLSAGEQQLLLLTSLALGPFPLLILDEALSCLDEAAFVTVGQALRALAASGVLVVLVSHELRTLVWADRCLGLVGGELVLDKPARELTGGDLGRMAVWPGTLQVGGEQRVLGPRLTQVGDGSVGTVSEARHRSDVGLAGQGELTRSGPVLQAPQVAGVGSPLEEAPSVERSRSQARLAGRADNASPWVVSHRQTAIELAAGELLCVAGVTGSGKSHLLATLAGHAQMPCWEVARAGYSVLLPQFVSSVLWHRSVRAELEASAREARRRGGKGGLCCEDLLELPSEWLERSPRSLSRGQMKMVACLCLLLQQPDLLLLDEPFGGLDASLRRHLERRLCDYLQAGGRAVLSTHWADEMVVYPHRLLLLEQGTPSYYGEPWSYFEKQPDPRLGLPSRLAWQRAAGS